MKMSNDDLSEAFREIKPSALREILVEIPKTTWNDVGGLEEARQELIEAIGWPLKTLNRSQEWVSSRLVVLLFGPPGPSKTLIVRAVADETEANFISVRKARKMTFICTLDKRLRSKSSYLIHKTIISFTRKDAAR
jgi:transitional endoplasmic reticulum ATPase